jgi:hypothetical protein
MYKRGPDNVHHTHSVMVLSASDAGITHILTFRDPALFELFDLPQTLGAPASESASVPDNGSPTPNEPTP